MDVKSNLLNHIVIDDQSCWNWTRATRRGGYGAICINGNVYSTHNVSYEVFVGEIPEGLILDHLCRNPRCINPMHLEPVTKRENTLRGVGIVAQYARRDRCIRGHVFNDTDTYYPPDGSRICRICRRDTMRTIRARIHHEAKEGK